MDSEEEQGTWIGGIYEKVGTLYSSFDNIASQDLLQYAETHILTAGANVRKFAEDQLSTTGANVKKFYSNFMQDVLSDTMKDSFPEGSQSEDTEKCYCFSCETSRKEDDRCHKDEVSKSDNSVVASASGKEMILEQNHIMVNVIPSEIPQVDVSEKNDVGMKPSMYRVDQSHDGGIEDQIYLVSKKSVLSQPSYSSSKGDRNAGPEPSVPDNLICHQNAIVSSGLDESRILPNEDDSTDGPDDGKAAGQAKDNRTRETGLNSTDPLPLDNTMAMDHHCDPVLSRNKSCCPSNFQVEQGALENGWEFMEIAGYGDHPVESNKTEGMSPKQSKESKIDWEFMEMADYGDHPVESNETQWMSPKQSKESKIDWESCESDWEIV